MYGGRWKPLIYLLRRSLFTDVIVACNEKLECFCRNDGIKKAEGEIHIEIWDLSADKTVQTKKQHISLEGGIGATGEKIFIL